ncbi:unnamed protein product [Cercospora beticola]|nr:unnamed protein product [Cercospora beticola]
MDADEKGSGCHIKSDGSISSDSMKGVGGIPGHPRIRTQTDTVHFLSDDLLTPDLDELSPWLWLMSTPSCTNITPLHQQRLRGREIVIMEDPGLHLVWHHRAIYIKPLPGYLLDSEFRERLLNSAHCDPKSAAISKAARGFLRSYALLIRHESDFRLAQSEHLQLIPEELDWLGFNEFIANFEDPDPGMVSPRYQNYGELRFSRLNMLVKVFLRKWHYRYTDGRYKDYLETFYAPLLFVFAVTSVVLNAMQVTLAVGGLDNRHWHSFWAASRGFASFTVAGTSILVVLVIVLLSRKIASEVIYATKMQLRRRFGRGGQRSSGGA